jgi:hypothetical protein
LFTEIVENPVEKIYENGVALQQPEEISGLHHRGAIHIRVKSTLRGSLPKPTDYTVISR